jgi:uncharacterized protein (DUF2141 family)
MKRHLVAAAIALSFAAPAFAEDVTVKLLGVEARGGRLMAALYTKEDYQKKPAFTAMAQAPDKKGDVVITFKNVIPGTYSMSVMHDEDSDGKMKARADGMPIEGWAVVNGDFLRAAPTFEDTKFEVVAGKPASITEMMHYGAK